MGGLFALLDPIYASYKEHVEVVKILLDGGADVEHEDCREETTLTLAARNNHSVVVKILAEKISSSYKYFHACVIGKAL